MATWFKSLSLSLLWLWQEWHLKRNSGADNHSVWKVAAKHMNK